VSSGNLAVSVRDRNEPLSLDAEKLQQIGADFSPCRTWRFALWRRWDSRPLVAFIGLNPSTADETRDDPTVRRCIGFAKAWGYGGLLMLNAYAFRATDPAELQGAVDPIGPEHDKRLTTFRCCASAFVAAWGIRCEPERAARVCEVIGQRIDCLGKTKNGAPRHPLYLKTTTTRTPYWSPVLRNRG
jgi:hypothetical protein